MIEPLARVDQLEDAVAEPITEEWDLRAAEYCLRNVSSKVRFHGDASWTPLTVPDHIKYLVIEVAARGYTNPEGRSLERGDMMTTQWTKRFAEGLTLAPDEIATIRESSIANRSGWKSVKAKLPYQYQGFYPKRGW